MIQNPHSDSLFDRPNASPPPAQPANRRLIARTRSGAESLPIGKRVISVHADTSRYPRCSRSTNTAGREAHSREFHRPEGAACRDGRPARPAAWFRMVIRIQSCNRCARVCRSPVVRAGTSASRIRIFTARTPPRIEPQGEGVQYAANVNSEAGTRGDPKQSHRTP